MANRAELIFGLLSAATVFAGGVWALLRGIFRQVGAVEANTAALRELTGRVDRVVDTQDEHAERIARLEGGRGSPGSPGRPRRGPGR